MSAALDLKNAVESKLSNVPAFVACEAVPVKLAVIVPAEKFPEPSLITGFDAVFAEANSVSL